jgi:hypothetical protein
VKKPKFSLLAFWKEVLLPKLEVLARKYGCVIRFQWDGAGPHTEEELVAWLRTEFGKRGWMFVFQPSQSPETNIHDFFIFPAMSKRMDHQTGGTTLLRVPQIAKAAMQVFQTMDPAPLHRSWAAHHALVSEMLADKGSNEFLRDSSRFHWGVRRAFRWFPAELADAEDGGGRLEVVEEHIGKLEDVITSNLSGVEIPTTFENLQEDERVALQRAQNGVHAWGAHAPAAVVLAAEAAAEAAAAIGAPAAAAAAAAAAASGARGGGRVRRPRRPPQRMNL